MTKIFRCEICGDAYIGDEAPSNCPFCGAKKSFIKPINEAKANFNVKLGEADKRNVETALKLEVSNAAFYFAASAVSKEIEAERMFKALGKVEAEHAVIWKKILKLPEIPKATEKGFSTFKENLEESHRREERAIKFYKEAAKSSSEPRVKQIFGALVLVEGDHLRLSEERL